MSQIFNKSTHPVTVKRIAVRVWALRDEIEAAIDRRIKECEAAGTALYIDDIKKYYGMRADQPLSEQPQLQLVDGEAAPSENIEQMMEALAAEAPTETTTEESPLDGSATDAPVETAHKADEIMATQSPEAAAKAPEAPHLQRPYTRTAPNSDKISYGFALLSDINMEWMLTFSKQGFIQGQSVVVEFLIPSPFMLSAEIMLCNNVAMRSRIISESKPDFRLQCRLTYALTGERTRLREFLTSVEPDLPKKLTAVKPQEEAGPEL
jgi:hypothetical protein